MKISSKSPGRCSREPSQITLSTSLSRRIRSNGGMKAGQASPMFTSSGKKRASSYENPEPSSPKVTCIGQVRVKTKKQSRKLTVSRSQGREVSFRDQFNINNNNNLEDFTHVSNQDGLHHRNQRWVHLPLTICESLRAFGADFNCFLPCRSSCMASEKDKHEKGSSCSGSNSCGAVFARWLVAMHEDEDRKDRKIVVDEEEEDDEDFTERRYRRHVFEDIEFCDKKNEQEEAESVGICVPPKNALLLMRCRSDPVKMAALANRFWEAPPPIIDDVETEELNENHIDNKEEENKVQDECGVEKANDDPEMELVDEKLVSSIMEEQEALCVEIDEVPEEAKQVEQEETQMVVDQSVRVQETEDQLKLNIQETEDRLKLNIQETKDHMLEDSEDTQEICSADQEPEQVNQESKSEEKEEFDVQESKQEEQDITEMTTCIQEQEQEMATTTERPEPDDPKTQEEETGVESKEIKSQPEQVLPDCLLLMMCEPKLSMEVSKETWVCSTDFIRWLPEQSKPRHVIKKDGRDQPDKRISADNKNPSSLQNNLYQPPRSSRSYPAKPQARAAGAESVTTVIETKLVGTKAYEPLVLKRCKSEPKKSAAKLAPESCFWKTRKVEPHCPAALGVGAAGVGF